MEWVWNECYALKRFSKCTEVDEEEDEDDEDEDEQDECGGEDETFQRVWVFDLCEK